MQTISKLLIASGLVIVTSPLCFIASAQDYIDVEAERAARAAAGVESAPSSLDPYAVRPARAYPAASYGLNSGPTGVVDTAAPLGVQSGMRIGIQSGGQGGGSDLGNLFFQIQQLQQEVMRLNGRVEEQAHELRQLREQSRQRYLDIDKRLSEQPASAAGEPTLGSSDNEPPLIIPAEGIGKSYGVEQPGEAEAYQAAYGLVLGRQFGQAIPAFRQFLEQHPEGRYAPNAHYWLGELFLVKDPPDLEASRQAFALLLSQYPSHSKAADALFKLGTVQFLKGNREKAREYLDLVVRQYNSSNGAVVKLARDFIAENY